MNKKLQRLKAVAHIHGKNIAHLDLKVNKWKTKNKKQKNKMQKQKAAKI